MVVSTTSAHSLKSFFIHIFWKLSLFHCVNIWLKWWPFIRKCPLGKEIFKVFEREIMGTFTCTGGVFQAVSGAFGQQSDWLPSVRAGRQTATTSVCLTAFRITEQIQRSRFWMKFTTDDFTLIPSSLTETLFLLTSQPSKKELLQKAKMLPWHKAPKSNVADLLTMLSLTKKRKQNTYEHHLLATFSSYFSLLSPLATTPTFHPRYHLLNCFPILAFSCVALCVETVCSAYLAHVMR